MTASVKERARAVEQLRKWREHPALMVRELFKVEPDRWQEEALEGFPQTQRMALKACKGPGKTTVLAWLGWNFLLTRPHPNIAATSITGSNLSDGLWKEMSKWQQKAPILQNRFAWTASRIFSKEYPETWWMSARTWARSATKDQQANTLAGLHAEYLLFLLDESGGTPEGVMAAAEPGLATGTECHIVQAGNPEQLEGPLYSACTKERHLWKVIEITGDPDDPKRSTRVSAQWAREQIEKYGKENPWVMVNVFGKFPPSSINSLVGPDEVTAAMERHLTEDKYSFAQKRLGIDVARFGTNKTVIFPRQGLAAFNPVDMRNARSEDIAGRIAEAKRKWHSEVELIDDTGGWAAGAIDALRLGGIHVLPVNFSSKANDPRYFNRRSEMYWLAAEWIKRGGALPYVPELVAELSTPKYWYEGGKLRLQEKEQIADILGRSPDTADALVLTFGLPDMPGGSATSASALESVGIPRALAQAMSKSVNYKSEYDPIEAMERI